jgi:hypothetical protein
MIAKVRRRAISSVRVLIKGLQLLLGCRPSLASTAALALAVDMMSESHFAKRGAVDLAWLADARDSDHLPVHCSRFDCTTKSQAGGSIH